MRREVCDFKRQYVQAKWLTAVELVRLVSVANTEAVAHGSPSSLVRFTIVMSGWLHPNLEDKVLFADGTIVVNQADFVRAYGY